MPQSETKTKTSSFLVFGKYRVAQGHVLIQLFNGSNYFNKLFIVLFSKCCSWRTYRNLSLSLSQGHTLPNIMKINNSAVVQNNKNPWCFLAGNIVSAPSYYANFDWATFTPGTFANIPRNEQIGFLQLHCIQLSRWIYSSTRFPTQSSPQVSANVKGVALNI